MTLNVNLSKSPAGESVERLERLGSIFGDYTELW